MTSTGIRAALIVAAAAGAFYVGRTWPRSSTEVAPAQAPPASTEASGARPVTPTSPAVLPHKPTTPPLVARADVPDEFARAVQQDAAAAARLRSNVVVTLDARRRQHNTALRACVDGGSMVEETQIRFSIEVSAHDHRIDVGPAMMADVMEGPALTDATLTCLLAALDQRDAVDLAADQSVVPYDGTIDVPIKFAPAAAPAAVGSAAAGH